MGLTLASETGRFFSVVVVVVGVGVLLLLTSSAVAHSTATLPFIEAVGSRSDGGGGGGDAGECVYTVYVRTGSIWKGGTDAVISVDLVGSDGYGVRITDLAAWGGIMEENHNYFERGNLDIFSGRGPCMASPPCWMNLTSDGSGAHHGWYCNYLEVTSTGPHAGCAQQLFTVEQWLATDAAPYRLYAVRDNCGGGADGLLRGRPMPRGRAGGDDEDR